MAKMEWRGNEGGKRRHLYEEARSQDGLEEEREVEVKRDVKEERRKGAQWATTGAPVGCTQLHSASRSHIAFERERVCVCVCVRARWLHVNNNSGGREVTYGLGLCVCV